MAINFLNAIDLNKNQLINPRFENLSADPIASTNPVEGQVYYNTTNDVLRLYAGNGAGSPSWQDVGISSISLTGDVTGTGTTSIATTISAGAVDFAMINPVAIVTSSENFTSIASDSNIATSKAIKEYVDLISTGGLVFFGGINADTGTPGSGAQSGNQFYDPDATPTTYLFDLAKDRFFVITDEGKWLGRETSLVTVGDMVIADVAITNGDNVDIADWTIVQADRDLATLDVVGVGNVNASSNTTVAYTGNVGTAFIDTKASNHTITGDASSTQFTVTHNFGTFNVAIQVYANASPYGVVFPQMVKTNVNTVRIDFGIAPAAGISYKVLINTVI